MYGCDGQVSTIFWQYSVSSNEAHANFRLLCLLRDGEPVGKMFYCLLLNCKFIIKKKMIQDQKSKETK